MNNEIGSHWNTLEFDAKNGKKKKNVFLTKISRPEEGNNWVEGAKLTRKRRN